MNVGIVQIHLFVEYNVRYVCGLLVCILVAFCTQFIHKFMSIIHAEQIENCDLVYFSSIFSRFFRVCALHKDKPNDSTNGFYFISTLEMQFEMRILFLTDVNSKAQNLSDLHL